MHLTNLSHKQIETKSSALKSASFNANSDGVIYLTSEKKIMVTGLDNEEAEDQDIHPDCVNVRILSVSKDRRYIAF